jgi:hypothetical protein
MKLEINYKIADVSADEDMLTARKLVASRLVAIDVKIMQAINDERRAALLQADMDEQRRWARFMHYCHTGVML